MSRSPLLCALFLIGCSFHPQIDPLAVRCVLGDVDSCPVGYACEPAPDQPPGHGLCCRNDGTGACAAPPDGGPPGDGAIDAPPADGPSDGLLADGTADGPADATGDRPVVDGALADTPVDAPADLGSDATMGPGCSDPCSPGAQRCGKNLGLEKCTQVGGCWTWSAEETCPGHMSCDGLGGQPRCQCGLTVCGPMRTAGDLCGEGVVFHCAVDGDGCGYVASLDFCPAGLVCGGSYPQGVCVCPPVPAECQGKQVGTFCAPGGLLATCGRDVYGCLVVTSQLTCPAGKPCTGSFPSASCSCATPNADCPGVGRGCGASGLTTCTLDQTSGCLISDSRGCGSGRVCTGSFSGADCVCGDAACKTSQTVGPYADLGGSSVHPRNVLTGVPIDIDVAFLPQRFGVIIRKPGADLQIQYGLFSSDARGEPDRMVAGTAARVAVGSGDARIEFDVMFPLMRGKLPSGRYWMLVALDQETTVAHAPAGPEVPVRSMSFPVDWHLDTRVPERFGPGMAPSTGTAPNYYLVVTPQ